MSARSELLFSARRTVSIAFLLYTLVSQRPNQQKGMIRGDDGFQLPFRRSNLRGVAFRALFSGLRVSYQIQDGWLGKEAVAVRPLSGKEGREGG